MSLNNALATLFVFTLFAIVFGLAALSAVVPQ